ncbi:hypothetical protein [Lysinibacillus parviboronicapiens]|uniref:hypothetical protein n=1 Tax=Lysinibacillus parviboronicapiens TaxID=436516 RepID=UPI000D388939|nr:hypothetical protein [Lysinibacillus parviboronicapiens]
MSGCLEDVKADWKTSPTFTKDNMILHGLEGKFGILKVNGESDEPIVKLYEWAIVQIVISERGVIC